MTRAQILVATLALFGAAVAVQAVRAEPHVPQASRLVSDVRYTLAPRDTVSTLRFTLAPEVRRVRVRLSPRDRWHACAVAGTRVTCPLRVPATALQRLQVDV